VPSCLISSCVVEESAGLVIKSLRNLGSTPDVVARRCVLGKGT